MSLYDTGWLFLFLNPENQPEKIQEYLKSEEQFLLDKIRPNSHLVDFGCGWGRHLYSLRDRLTYGLGLDKVEKYIDIGRMNLSEYSNIEFRVADILSVYINKKFDYAICMHNTLGNIDGIQLVLTQMRRIISDSGSVIAGVYSENSIESRVEWYERTGLVVREITTDYIITSHGFKSGHFSKKKLFSIFGDCTIEEISEIGYIIISS